MPKINTQWGAVDIPDGASDDDIDRAIDGYRAKLNQPATSGNSSAPWLANFLGDVANNVGAFGHNTAEQGKALWDFVNASPIDQVKQAAHGAVGVGKQVVQQGQRALKTDPFAATDPTTYIPGVGNDMLNMRAKMRGGDYPGAVADALGLGAQAALPELLPEAKGLTAARSAKSGQRMYIRSLGLPESMSLDEMKAVGKLGTDLKAPVGELFGAYGSGEKSIAKLGGPQDPASFIGKTSLQTEAALQPHLNEPLDYNEVFKPLTDRIKMYRGAVRGSAVADQLEQMATDFMHQHGFIQTQGPSSQTHQLPGLVSKERPGLQSITWQTTNPGGGQSMRPITVGEGQAMKKATYGILPDNTWADNANSLGPTERMFNELMSRGLRNAVSKKVPEVEALNQQMHSAIYLRDNLIRSEKRANYGALPEELGPLGMGAAMGELSNAAGSPYSSGPGLAATLAARGAKWPSVRSRMGIRMAQPDVVGRAVSKVLGLLPGASQLDKDTE